MARNLLLSRFFVAEIDDPHMMLIPDDLSSVLVLQTFGLYKFMYLVDVSLVAFLTALTNML